MMPLQGLPTGGLSEGQGCYPALQDDAPSGLTNECLSEWQD